MSLTRESLLQYLLPQHTISRISYLLARWHGCPYRLRLTYWFIRKYGVNLDEAAQPDVNAYPHFNSFFTRALRPGVRPISSDPAVIACPVDGRISQIGYLSENRLIQAKGVDYTLEKLLGGDTTQTQYFTQGSFATLYLAPGDYHRVHMPFSGQLVQTTHVPGKLFSVSPECVRSIPGLFARNERVVSLFDTEIGPMAVILVGAINVGCIETVWAGKIKSVRRGAVSVEDYSADLKNIIRLGRGDEMGRFNMGSTVILLFGKDRVHWDISLQLQQKVQLGQTLGQATL